MPIRGKAGAGVGRDRQARIATIGKARFFIIFSSPIDAGGPVRRHPHIIKQVLQIQAVSPLPAAPGNLDRG